jgi:ribosome-interacting GTPase 1
MLEIVRVYPKGRNQKPDFSQPFIIKKGTKLIELASQIHEDLAKNFKYANYSKKTKNFQKLLAKNIS